VTVNGRIKTRLLVLGVDSEGRSCIAREGAPDALPVAPGMAPTIANLFSIRQSPPAPTAPGQSRFRPDVLRPGHVDWYIVDHPPHAEGGQLPPQDLHHRNVVDCLFVFEGSAQLLLGTERIRSRRAIASSWKATTMPCDPIPAVVVSWPSR
jgi:hypothetical protein